MAISLQEGGSERATLRTLTGATRAFWPERIPNVFGGEVNRLPGSRSFFIPLNSDDPRTPRTPRATSTPSAGCTAWVRPRKPTPKYSPGPITRPCTCGPTSTRSCIAPTTKRQLYGQLYSVDCRVDAWEATPADLSKPAIACRRLAAPTDSVYNYLKLGDKM